MTLRSRLFSCFLRSICLALALTAWFVAAPTWVPLLSLFAHLYVLPVACYRCTKQSGRSGKGTCRLDLPDVYVPWWAGTCSSCLSTPFLSWNRRSG